MNNYEFEETEEGSGQGSVCSPVISCIYMHYVLVWWFKEVITPKLKGYAGLVAFCASQWPLVRLPVATWRYEWPEVNRPLCVRS